jgi:hypothetical protein
MARIYTPELLLAFYHIFARLNGISRVCVVRIDLCVSVRDVNKIKTLSLCRLMNLHPSFNCHRLPSNLISTK